MLTPDYKAFLQLSRDFTLVPVAKTLSADLLTPVAAFLSVAAKQKYAFLLESVEGGEKIGRYTFLGAQPRMVVTARGKELTASCSHPAKSKPGPGIWLRPWVQVGHPAASTKISPRWRKTYKPTRAPAWWSRVIINRRPSTRSLMP